jgi:hypothetical protein
MSIKKPVLVDLDEVLYPFVHTWDLWLQHTKNQTVDWEALVWYYDLDLYLPKYVDLQPDFVKAHVDLLNPQPIPGSIEALSLIASSHPIIACTARNSQDWSGTTEKWLATHAPFISDVVYIRNGRGHDPIPKGEIAKKLKAHAHIDDTKHWIDTLPPSIKGYVLKRPAPLASDEGAKTWDQIVSDIL